MIWLAFLACTQAPHDSGDTSNTDTGGPVEAPAHTAHPLDDVLRVNHIQTKGTHNSYHVQPETSIPDWDYTHPPLTEQLETWGVRQFELDVHLGDEGEIPVFHVPIFDEGTTCPTLPECLGELRAWSNANRGHVPLSVFIEVKDDPASADFNPARFDDLDAVLEASWPAARRLTPDRLRGQHSTLAEAAADGWPTLGELRGGVMFVLLDGAEVRDAYLDGHPELEGRQMFVYGRGGEPAGVVDGLDSPTATDAIHTALAAGHLVRTRADSVTESDPARRDAAFAVGANWVSTDWPTDAHDYQVNLPGGSPARCNPVTAPEPCSATDVEDPERLRTVQP